MDGRGHQLRTNEAKAFGGAARASPGIDHEQRNPARERYITRRELRALFPVSDMTIWRWQHDPEVAFPAPVKLNNNGRNYWWFPAICDWEQRRRNAVDPNGRKP